MQYIHSAREYLSPLLKESKFKDTGLLTVDEFVLAGDYIVSHFPSWQWASGRNSRIKSYLPIDKQYLVSRNVPCLYRLKTLDVAFEQIAATKETNDETDDNSWTVTSVKKGHLFDTSFDADTIQEITTDPPEDLEESYGTKMYSSVDQEFFKQQDQPDELDPDDFIIDDIEDDVAALRNENIVRTRSYDISITYDKYYQTPRIWLTGYDEYRNYLSNAEVFEDISPEHAKKTVTIEMHPHEPLTTISIHPCQHANVMKILINGNKKRDEIQIQHYLLIFLKFIHTIIPSMEYEFVSIF